MSLLKPGSVSHLIGPLLGAAVVLFLLLSCRGSYQTAPRSEPRPDEVAVPASAAASRAPLFLIEPTYNVTIDQREAEAPLPRHVVVANEQPNVARLSIGLPDPDSVIPEARPHVLIREYTGELQVVFHCLVCADQRPERRTIAVEAGRSISDVAFAFLPTLQGTHDHSGYGSLVFTMYRDERAIDRITVPILIAPVTPMAIAAASARPLPPVVTTLSEALTAGVVGWVSSPSVGCINASMPNCSEWRIAEQPIDIRLQIDVKDDRIVITASPRTERMVQHLQQAGWRIAEDGEIGFETALTTTTLRQRLITTYERLQAVIKSGSDPELRAAVQALTGNEVSLDNPIRLTLDQGKALSHVLATAGRGLYIDLRRAPNGRPDVSRFFDALAKFASDHAEAARPLRILVHNSTAYAIPWQLLYVQRLDPLERTADPKAFLGYMAEVSEDRVVLGAIRAVDEYGFLDIQGSNILYAMYSNGTKHEDVVTVRASGLLAYLKSIMAYPEKIAAVTTRESFVTSLRDRSQRLRLIAIYAHGSANTPVGAPALRLNEREYITPDDLRNLADNTQNYFGANPVILLAACELGTGGRRLLDDNDFPATFLSLGSSAVIAPVSEIWSAYADWFARDFLSLHHNGNSVPQAVRGTVRKHVDEYNNPAGLLFSIFGDPTT